MGKIKIRSTTVLAVYHKGQMAIGADGQVTMGATVAKSHVKKIRNLSEGKIVTGFAGSTADAFTLLDRFDEKLSAHSGNLKRAAVELAKDWRRDKYLRQLEAMMIVADKNEMLIISGTGDVLDPEEDVASIGSGSQYVSKTEHAPLFQPQQNYNYPTGAPIQTDFVKSRVNPSMRHANSKPWEEVKVATGLNQGYTTNSSSQGFNSALEARDSYKPRGVDELRAKNNPKQSYSLDGHKGPA